MIVLGLEADFFFAISWTLRLLCLLMLYGSIFLKAFLIYEHVIALFVSIDN